VRLGLLPGLGSAPLLLGLAGGGMGARRRPPRREAGRGVAVRGEGRHITIDIRQTTPLSTDLSYAQIFDDFRLGCWGKKEGLGP
jgi:hypothetical protein